ALGFSRQIEGDAALARQSRDPSGLDAFAQREGDFLQAECLRRRARRAGAEAGEAEVEFGDVVIVYLRNGFFRGCGRFWIGAGVVMSAADVGPDAPRRRNRVRYKTGIGLRHALEGSERIVRLAAQQRAPSGKKLAVRADAGASGDAWERKRKEQFHGNSKIGAALTKD